MAYLAADYILPIFNADTTIFLYKIILFLERVPSEIRDNIAFEGESSVQQPDLLATEISEPTTKLLHDVSYFRFVDKIKRIYSNKLPG